MSTTYKTAKEEPQRNERRRANKSEILDAQSTQEKIDKGIGGFKGYKDALNTKLTSEYVIQGAGAVGGAALGLLLSGLIHHNPSWLLRLLYAGGGGAAGWFGTEALMDPRNMRREAWKRNLSEKDRAAVDRMDEIKTRLPESDWDQLTNNPLPGLATGSSNNILAPQTGTQGAMDLAILGGGGTIGALRNMKGPTGGAGVYRTTVHMLKHPTQVRHNIGHMTKMVKPQMGRNFDPSIRKGAIGAGKSLLVTIPLTLAANYLANRNNQDMLNKDM